MGAENHADPIFLTILLQDDRGGLQILHKGHWFDVPPRKGGLVVNIGDMIQVHIVVVLDFVFSERPHYLTYWFSIRAAYHK